MKISREGTRRDAKKKNMWRVPIWMLVFFVVSMPGRLFAENQTWINNSFTFNVRSGSRIVFFNEYRFNDMAFGDLYLGNLQVSFLQRIFKNVHMGAAYKRQHTEKLQYTLKESRYIFEAGWGTNLSRSLDLRCRFNAEIRRFEADVDQNHLRFRLRFLLFYKMAVLKLKTIPFIGVEPFYDTIADEISQNRWYTGILIPFSRKIRLELSYTRKDQKNRDVLHVFNTGLHFEF